jgi:CheY-like chemotaxis protein
VLLAPATLAGLTPAAPPPEANATSARARVLVVDDEPYVGKAIQRTLKALHDVVVVQRATEALARVVSGERYDVILCDLMMPEMSGMDLHAAIAEKAPAMLDRMIFLTGGAFTDGARAFFDRVTNVKLDKPVSRSALHEAVARFKVGDADPRT